MMMSKLASANDDGDGNLNSGQFLREIEAISKALYLQKAPQKAFVSPSSVRSRSVERPRLLESRSNFNTRVVDDIVSSKDKKSPSVWNWKKPLKALAHIGHQKFNIIFFLHVHSIEGLPPSFNDINLSVHWKRKNDVVRTRPSKPSNGVAEFDETLMHKCSVYGSRSGLHHSAKYEMKLFLIYAVIVGAPIVDMGKQLVDLTRLLPFTLEELDGEKGSGKWTTSFKLSGKAKGATLNTSFGFSVLRDNLFGPKTNMNIPALVNLDQSCTTEQKTGFGLTDNNGTLRRVGSVPSNLDRRSALSSQSVDLKICDEVSPNLGLELSRSIAFLYQKLNVVNQHGSLDSDTLSEHLQTLKPRLDQEFDYDKNANENDDDDADFTVIDWGIEYCSREQSESEKGSLPTVDDDSAIETINMYEIIKEDDNGMALDEDKEFNSVDNIFDNYLGEVLVDDYKDKESSMQKKGPTGDNLEPTSHGSLMSKSRKLGYPLSMSEFLDLENYMEAKSNYKSSKVVKESLSLDETAESVASDFLNMLGIEHSPFALSSESEPESPRERLLREFEKEASGSFIIGCEANTDHENFGFSVPVDSGGRNLSEHIDLSLGFQVSVDEHQSETQLLSRRKAKMLEDLETEALMREWGLNENAFQNSPRHCSDGFGSPIELSPEGPVELPPLGDGFGSFVCTKDRGYLRSMSPSIFKNSKSVGTLIMQVSCPIVLPAEMGPDIMDVLQHLASVGIEKLSLQANKLMPLLDITGKTLQQIAQDAAPRTIIPDGWYFNSMNTSRISTETGLEYRTLEDLVPLAMDKIEAMLIEGLRIQSGMSEEEAPSSISPPYARMNLNFEGKRGTLGEFFSLELASQLQQVDFLDGGIDIDGLLSLSITLEEWLRLDAGIIVDEDQVTEQTRLILAVHHAKCVDYVDGKLTRCINLDEVSNQKHGLLGNNLTVAFKVMLRDPLRNFEPVGTPMLALVQVERASPKVYDMVLERCKNSEKYDERCSLFKITEVHVLGLTTKPGKMHPWGSQTQQQSGSRWLLANSMSKSNKHQYSKSKAIVVSYPKQMVNAHTGDIMWSLSSQANGTENVELAGFVPHIRNPNIIFPK